MAGFDPPIEAGGSRDELAAVVCESRTGHDRERFDELEVVGGRDDRDVPHVGGEEGQLRLHVETGAVPPEEHVHGECVALIPISE